VGWLCKNARWLFDKDHAVSRVLPLLLLLLCLSAMGDAVDYENQSITVALTQEPPSLNTLQMTDLVSFFIVGHTGEGLVRYDRRGVLVPGVAASWEITDDSILFHLREDAKWSDGSGVTADDFVFAWRGVNDPLEAAPFAAIMYPIRNAERIQNGELPKEQLGVHAVDSHTLRVDLENPCGYCLSLMPHGTFYPIQQKFYQQAGQKYGAEPEHLLSNGAFEVAEWVHGSRLRLRRNMQYWDSQAITLNEINIGYITEDNRTRLNLFVDGKIALVRLGAETVTDASSQGLRLRTFPSGGLSYLRFNMADERVTRHQKLRQAIQAVFDPEVFVNKVIAIPGYSPAYTFFPRWLRGARGKFSEEYPVPPRKVDVVRGRALISELRRQQGELGSIALLTVASPTGAKVAEYFQGLLKQSLALDVRVDQQTLKQYLVKSRAGQFDIAISSWYPDFDDIMTYADLQASWNNNNRGKYANAEYDRLVRVLQSASEPELRMNAAARLQDILIEDVPVLPAAETGSTYILHSRLKGVTRRVIGQDPDYTYARVVK
jgi:oligopeptide transport system substrate-binding protein